MMSSLICVQLATGELGLTVLVLYQLNACLEDPVTMDTSIKVDSLVNKQQVTILCYFNWPLQ